MGTTGRAVTSSGCVRLTTTDTFPPQTVRATVILEFDFSDRPFEKYFISIFQSLKLKKNCSSQCRGSDGMGVARIPIKSIVCANRKKKKREQRKSLQDSSAYIAQRAK